MSTPVPQNLNRRQQLMQSYKMAKQHDPALGLWIAGAAVLGAVIGFGLIAVVPGGMGVFSWISAVICAVLGAFLFGMIIFGRRVQKAAYKQMDGQIGAAAATLGMLRRGWKIEPAVGFTKQQDVVHRVIGPPGVILVGEGNSHNRVKGLLATEHRKHSRVLSETPIFEVVSGKDADNGEVDLPDLIKHVRKLGRNIKPAEMTDVINRLKALDAQRGQLPIPKGPMPTSMKGQRGNLRGR
ncbi:DUF4191 domain-containing protein [Nocardioides yefusunii]|uniref:DUF4191 domain-containing protein n=1 Tax=Nocardioides yefusunii TaxID=2500546 RepID=A0ABW1QUF7_9ACTN|nr:DUF4191 domain-containing protein [Nocardioides yefusunii]